MRAPAPSLIVLALALTLGVRAAVRADDTGPRAEPLVVDEGALPEDLVQIAIQVRDRPLGDRMRAISEPLMGRPYLVDATGEGGGPDPDPPARYDAFDCLTFVEEILALALPADPRSAPMVRNGLRYTDEAPRYENRNHFMLGQWIPNNIEAGWLEDITADLGEEHFIDKVVDQKTWAWWKRRKLFALTDEQLPTGHYLLPVLSPTAAAAALDKIPDGALILTVRQSREYVPIVVTHLGFKVPSESAPIMRHATKMGTVPRVRDDRLSWYFEHLKSYTRWPVEGVNILMPRELGPRVSALRTQTKDHTPL